ncbi:MAG: hypothetical protein GX754_07155, partial [Clostridiaceae bacterium]|nr:hypothetical protein [Clostridiaceae bacterium]
MVFPGERKTSVISRYTVDIVLSVFTSFSIVYALTYTMKFDYHPFIIFLSVLLAVLICLIIFLNRLTTIITIISAGVAACSWLLYLAWNKLFPGLANSFTGYVSWLYDYSNGSVEINEIYRDYTFILLVAGLSLAIYLFTIKRLNFPMVLSTGMSIFVIQWVMEYAINYLSFYLFVFLSVLYYLKHIYIKKRLKTGNDYTAPASFMINILPLCAVIFIFSFAIPKSESPVEWEWLDRQINKIYDFMND